MAIDKEKGGNVSMGWLGPIEELSVSALEKGAGSSTFQKDVMSLQDTTISENPIAEKLELNYGEYKLLEILTSGETVFDTLVDCKDSWEDEMGDISLPTQKDNNFNSNAVQVCKFSNVGPEQPQLCYSIFIKVANMLANHLNNEESVLCQYMTAFMTYFDQISESLLPKVKSCSREESTGSPLDLSMRGDSKITRQINTLADNVRIFSCFLADFSIYYYNLDQLVFKATSSESEVVIAENPFFERELISDFYMEKILEGERGADMREMIAFECRDANELLKTNTTLLRKCNKWEGIGLPKELLSPASPDRVSFFGNSQEKSSKTVLLVLSSEKEKTLCEDSFERDLKLPTLKEKGIPFDATISFSEDCTAIGVPGPGDTWFNDTQDGILAMLQTKDSVQNKNLFKKAGEAMSYLSTTCSPCAKLAILCKATAIALQELRQEYSTSQKEEGRKVRVGLETLLGLMLYISVKSGIADLTAEYRFIKVFFLLPRGSAIGRFITLWKSALKSINKAGLYLAQSLA